MRKDPVYEVMEKEKVCRLDHNENLIDTAILFRIQARPHECYDGKTIAVRYCSDCRKPPYFDWSIRTAL